MLKFTRRVSMIMMKFKHLTQSELAKLFYELVNYLTSETGIKFGMYL